MNKINHKKGLYSKLLLSNNNISSVTDHRGKCFHDHIRAIFIDRKNRIYTTVPHCKYILVLWFHKFH